MSESYSFSASDFFIESVVQQGATTLLLTLTQTPLLVSAVGPHDGLNPGQYSLSGSAAEAVVACAAVAANARQVLLQLNVPLIAGTWILTISSNLQTPGGRALQAPLTISFLGVATAITDTITGGAQTDSPTVVISKHLSPYFRGKKFWSALVSALASSDQVNQTNAQLAFDQLFSSTASSFYLDRKMAANYVQRPEGVGMSDAEFRTLGIEVNSEKLTQRAILEVLQVFYGTDSVRAYLQTGLPESYALIAGQTLQLLIDEKQVVNVTFQTTDFAQQGVAKAQEVAAAITRAIAATGSLAYAVAQPSAAVTSQNYVRVYSNSLGLKSGVRITGGTAQTVLQFPLLIPIPPSATTPSSITWNVSTAGLSPLGTAKYLVAGGNFDVTQVRVGDYLNVQGQNFQTANRGSFPVTAVYATSIGAGTSYIEVTNINAVAQTGVAEAALTDVLVFRPQRGSIQAQGQRTVTVVQSQDTLTKIIIPATSDAVTRTLYTGAYLNVAAALSPDSADKTLVTTGGFAKNILTPSTVTINSADASKLTAGGYVFVNLGASDQELVCITSVGASSFTAISMIGHLSGATLTVPGVYRPGLATSVTTSLSNPETVTAQTLVVNAPAHGFTVASTFQAYVDAYADAQLIPTRYAGNEQSTGVAGTADASNVSIIGNIRANDIGTTIQGLTLPITAANGAQQVICINGVKRTSGNPISSGTLVNAAEIFELTAETNLHSGQEQLTYNWITQTTPGIGAVCRLAGDVIPLGAANGGSPFACCGASSLSPFTPSQNFGWYNVTTGVWSTGTTGTAVANPCCSTRPAAYDSIIVGGGAITQRTTTQASKLIIWNGTAYASFATLQMVASRAEMSQSALPDGNLLVTGGRPLSLDPINDYACQGFFQMHDTSGNNAVDSGQSGYTLVGTNSPAISTAGITGNLYCRDFSPSGSYMSLSGSTAWQNCFLGEWTFETWINVGNGSYTSTQYLSTYSGSGINPNGNVLMLVALTTSGGLTKITWDWQNGSNNFIAPTINYLQGPTAYGTAWHHIAVRKKKNPINAGNYDVSIFLDGVLVAFNANNANASDGSVASLYVPSFNTAAPFDGFMTDVRISNIARTDADVYRSWRRGTGDLFVSGSGEIHASTEIWADAIVSSEPSGSWTSGPPMAWARVNHTQTLLPDGRVMVCGGFGYPAGQTQATAVLSSVEFYNPSLNSWTPGPAMPQARALHAAIYLASSNRVLVIGGVKDMSLDEANPVFLYYDLNTSTWAIGPTALLPQYTSPSNIYGFDWIQAAGCSYTGTSGLNYPAVLLVGGYTGGQQRLYVPAADRLSTGGINSQVTVSVPDANTLLFSVDRGAGFSVNSNTALTLTPDTAPAATATGLVGPYIYDLQAGVAITSIQTTTTQEVFAGQPLATLGLASVTGFPKTPGYVALGFGTGFQISSLQYLGVTSTSPGQLALNYSQVPSQTVPSGSSAILLSQFGPWQPTHAQAQAAGSFYLTDSSSGRLGAQRVLLSIVGAGLNIDMGVNYPGDWGLGGSGFPTWGQPKLSDAVIVWGSNYPDTDYAAAEAQTEGLGTA